MSEKLLREIMEQAGMATPAEITEWTGEEMTLWREHARTLIEQKEVLFCRLDHGRETFLSRHLHLCILAVYTEPTLSQAALGLYHWLLDAGPVSYNLLRRSIRLYSGGKEFALAFLELQQKLCVVPLLANAMLPVENEGADFSHGFAFLWVTNEYWMEGIRRPNKYKDLEYCLSEIRRLMKNRFTTREIDDLIYRGII